MAAAIREVFPDAEVDLRGGGRGDFTVKVDGALYWDKHNRGGFPDEGELVARLEADRG